MKICVTTKKSDPEADTDPHFGLCMYFMFVDTDTMHLEFIGNPYADASQGAGVQAAQYIAGKEVNALICSNPGPNAISVMEASGIRVVKLPEMKALEAVQTFLANDIKVKI
jgi:predicted Fe-Mo cluster-binding NifX family protein